MKAASLNEIKKELRSLDPETLQEICMRLAKFKKENKELITYLLLEAHHEQSYIENVKEELEEQFKTLPRDRNTYYIKKNAAEDPSFCQQTDQVFRHQRD